MVARKVKTRIVIQMEEGFPGTLYMRGEGLPELSWDKGVELKHELPGEWIFETHEDFNEGAFKVLIEDEVYEMGDNHPVYPGVSMRVNKNSKRIRLIRLQLQNLSSCESALWINVSWGSPCWWL